MNVTAKESYGDTHQENDRHVEHECHGGVQHERNKSQIVDLVHGDLVQLQEAEHDEVHGRARRSKIVQRDEGIHLELATAQESLYHSQSSRLAQDADNLHDEADHHELDLAVGGNDDAQHDHRDVTEGLEVWRCHAQAPCYKEYGNWCSSLEHLDEGDGEVEVGGVGEHEGEREEEADGDDGAEVDAACHGHLFAGVEDGGEAGEHLRDEGGEDQVPCRQEDCCASCVSR